MTTQTIESLRAKRGQVFRSMEALGNTDRPLTPDEKQQFEGFEAEIRGYDDQIARAENVARMKAQYATPVNPEPTQPRVELVTDQSEKREKGDAVARIIRSLAATKGVPGYAAEHCRKVFGDEQVAKALASATGTAGGFLVPDNFSAEIIELLRPMAKVRNMGAIAVPMPGGNMIWPKVATGSSAAYIGENTNITKTEPTFGQLRLTARKLAALVPISNDLIRFSSPAADQVVRQDLVAAMAQAEDAAFIRDQGIGNAPKGLRYWAASGNVIAANTTVTIATVSNELGRAIQVPLDGNVPMIRPGWLMAPRTYTYLSNLRTGTGGDGVKVFPEMEQGLLRGYPFQMTTQIPVNLGAGTDSEVYFVDFAQCVIGEVPGFIIDVSDTAAYHDGSAVVAAFSQDQTVIRVIAQHDFGVRQVNAVAVISTVRWIP